MQQDLLEPEPPAPAGAIDGVWRLCFCEGDFLHGIEADKHGYLGRNQQVDVRFDCSRERIVLGSSGLSSSLPKIVPGDLAYTQETQTVVGTFDKEAVGIGSLVLNAILVDGDALGFRTVSQGEEGLLLFRAEKSKRAAERLSERAVDLSGKESEAQGAVTAAPAHEEEPNIDLKLVSDEGAHEDRRLAIEETGRQTGSFNTFMRYLETEVPSFYVVLAGPVLVRFARHYIPIVAAKVSAALIVLSETLHQFSGSSA